ncbi:MAG TPA: metalloregulator ArsR/SmtB family transcription factor [Micropepsaceae bacterium]|nr:metalloregulator ArsR/SmtB family transcription factor [Micropepsaceae bacterium]
MTAFARIDRIFSALADPTRRAIVQRLASGEATVTELARPFTISLPAISRHLRVLEAAALVRQERDGQFRRCRLDTEGLQTAAEWLDFYRHFWGESLDRLDEHLKSSVPRAPKTKGRSHGKYKAHGRR